MKLEFAILFLCFIPTSSATALPPSPPCEKNSLFTTQGVTAWSSRTHSQAFFYTSGMAIDADGAYRAYHPVDRLGLDSLNHAGRPGNWWALVTDNGKPSGRPVVQKKPDPAPGFYVSTTALYDPANPHPRDPHRYVNAAKIPYVVLPPKALSYARLGDFATVVNLQNRKVSGAIVADESTPDVPFGEGSMALAKALGVNSSPRRGGKNTGIFYLIYAGSGNGRPQPLKQILTSSKRLFEAWGGSTQLNACLASD